MLPTGSAWDRCIEPPAVVITSRGSLVQRGPTKKRLNQLPDDEIATFVGLKKVARRCGPTATRPYFLTASGPVPEGWKEQRCQGCSMA